jgi:flagellar biosynthesis component FlhA
MKLTTLQGFFNKIISADSFQDLIRTEVEHYKLLLSKTGSSVPVVLDEDTYLSIGGSEVSAICQAFIDEHISEYDVYYIVDALLLSNRITFASESLLDLLETLTDPQVNGKLTKSVASEVLLQCK